MEKLEVTIEILETMELSSATAIVDSCGMLKEVYDTITSNCSCSCCC